MGKKEVKIEGTMKSKTAVHTTLIKNFVFVWHITKYTLLETGRLYFQVCRSNSFTVVYMLLKTRRSLHIAFRCGYSAANGMFFLSNGGPMSKLVSAFEISDGLYVSEFPETLILHERGTYVTKGICPIVFKFITDGSTSLIHHDLDGVGVINDFDELCHDMQSAYVSSMGHDFIIKAGGVEIRTHKCVLYARSKFFEQYFGKDESASEFVMPDTLPGVMHVVLVYMYSGELDDLKPESMVSVLQVAYLLKIPMLKERCLNFFEATDTWEAIESLEFFEYDIED